MKQIKARDILSKSGFNKTSTQSTISSVYSNLKSAHDAVFVFDENEFKGLVNLYYSLLKKRPPGKAKIRTVIYNPPKIDLQLPISEVARLMLESRVYQLPVFNTEAVFQGSIEARRILRWALKLPHFSKSVSEVFYLKKPFYIYLKDGVDKGRNLMINQKVSRLLVLDKTNKLVGIVSSYDLRHAFSSPVETIHFMSRTPIKRELGNLKIEKFYKKNIISIRASESAKKVIESILENDVGSVLVFDSKGKSIGLVSTRDILKYIWETLGKKEKTKMNFTFAKSLTKRYQQSLSIKFKKNHHQSSALIQKN